MASKYINLEAAAAQLSISVEELNRLREAGEIRAFADRGTWKFKSDDLDSLARKLEPDSGFDMPTYEDDEIVLDDDLDIAGGSKVILDEEMGDQPTVISKQAPHLPPSSDSDVRLVVDPSLESDAWSQPPSSKTKMPPKTTEMQRSGSDVDPRLESDVRFVDVNLSNVAPTPIRIETESDSKIKIQESDDRWAGISDSDVRLAPLDEDIDSSNITIQGESGFTQKGSSDYTLRGESDYTLRGGSDYTLRGESDYTLSEEIISLSPVDDAESDVTLIGEDEVPPLSGLDLSGSDINDPGSDITLMSIDDESGPRLLGEDDEAEEDSILSDMLAGPASGLSFSSGDSGISLDLAIDSGISLEADADNDDSLTLAADSGVSLVPDSGIGLSLGDPFQESEETGGATIPMLQTAGDDDDDTSFDMPLLEDSGAEIDPDDDDTTNIVMFDEDEDSAADTMEFDSAELSDDDFSDFDDQDDFDQLSDDEMDVSDELLSDDDVLEAADGDFEDDFESGESVTALPVSGGLRGGVGVAAVAAEWDMLSFSLVLCSTLFMGLCTLLMYDVVKSMWAHETPLGVNGMILEALQGIIKS